MTQANKPKKFDLSKVKAKGKRGGVVRPKSDDARARPYQVANATLPSGFAPDFGLAQLRAGRGDCVFTFTRVELMRLGAVSRELYTTTFNISFGIEYAVTIDLSRARFFELQCLWPMPLREHLNQLVMNSPSARNVDLPRHTFFFGVRAHLGTAQRNLDETYVPFVADALMAASERFDLVVG